VDRRAKIIQLNDKLRTTFRGGRVQMTPGFYDLDEQVRGRALAVMARQNRFDRTSEHDWGVFIFAGYSFEWHIEYRGKDGAGLSPDPTDPDKTFRVLTVYAVVDVLAQTTVDCHR
jgi:Protein of unknown function (DUF3768)